MKEWAINGFVKGKNVYFRGRVKATNEADARDQTFVQLNTFLSLSNIYINDTDVQINGCTDLNSSMRLIKNKYPKNIRFYKDPDYKEYWG